MVYLSIRKGGSAVINELYELSRAMEQAGINAQSWYRKYKPLPNISAKAPCIHITIENGQVISLSEVPKKIGCNLRRFGDNQGFYPGMNLAPLYRITDDTIKKTISNIAPEQIDEQQIEKFKQWCTDNNWVKKFQDKYAISMRTRPADIKALLGIHNFHHLDVLISETSLFSDPLKLHSELEKCAFLMLSRKENVKTALSVLFYLGGNNRSAADDFGSLSVIFDTPKLFSQGISVVSNRFTNELNDALLLADTTDFPNQSTSDIIDAFSTPFEPIEEPMPEVKLAGGINVKLRTMFKEQHCQYRYGRIGDATYPLSPENRKKFQAALTWLGGGSRTEGYYMDKYR